MTDDRVVHARGEFPDVPLRRRDLARDPIRQLEAWLAEAERSGEPDPYAMSLATVTPDGTPNARVVTLKRLDGHGLVFTSSSSAKVRELRRTPTVAAVFYWPRLARQVRLVGTARRTTPDEDDALYAPRSRVQRLALRTGPQGTPLPDRGALEARFAALDQELADPVPRPDDWGGWRVVPTSVEFWQGRERRLHDRFAYTATASGGWSVARLAP